MNSDINQYYKNVVSKTTQIDKSTEFELMDRYVRFGDIDAAKQLVEANLRFVAYIARAYVGYGLPIEDIIQEGNIGLLKAVKSFDQTKGIRLVTYAAIWVKSEIHEYIMKNMQVVRVATTKQQRKLFFNLRKSRKSLEPISQEEAIEISKKLKVDILTIYEMEMRLNGGDVSFNMLDEDDGFSNPESYIEAPNSDPANIIEELDEYQSNIKILDNALDNLDAISNDVIKSRWLSETKSTLHELGVKYSLSYERIRQIESKALKSMKLEFMVG